MVRIGSDSPIRYLLAALNTEFCALSYVKPKRDSLTRRFQFFFLAAGLIARPIFAYKCVSSVCPDYLESVKMA